LESRPGRGSFSRVRISKSRVETKNGSVCLNTGSSIILRSSTASMCWTLTFFVSPNMKKTIRMGCCRCGAVTAAMATAPRSCSIRRRSPRGTNRRSSLRMCTTARDRCVKTGCSDGSASSAKYSRSPRFRTTSSESLTLPIDHVTIDLIRRSAVNRRNSSSGI
jgi:hypothetical protein